MQKKVEKYTILIANDIFPRLLSICSDDTDKACELVKEAARKYVDSNCQMPYDEFDDDFVKGLTSRAMFLVIHQAQSNVGGKDFVDVVPCATMERAREVFEATKQYILHDKEMWTQLDEWHKNKCKEGCPYHSSENENEFIMSDNESFSYVRIEKRWVEE